MLDTYTQSQPLEIEAAPCLNGVIDETALRESLGDSVAAVLIQSPNFFGCVERLDRIIDTVHACGALAIVATDPLASGVFKTPGAFGADLVVCEGQAPLHGAIPLSVDRFASPGSSGPRHSTSLGCCEVVPTINEQPMRPESPRHHHPPM